MTEQKTKKKIEREMQGRRGELINLQKKQGGTAAIKLCSDNLEYCYNPDRKTSDSNPRGEKFYLTGQVNGCPVTINEIEFLLS